MPVLEDGLSDSENLSDDEQIKSPIKSKVNGRHQSTQSDFLFDSNHSSLITSSHKRQFAKTTPTATNGVESQSKSFYIRPPPPSSFVQPVLTNRSTPPAQSNESNWNQQKTSSEETPTIPAGKQKYIICLLIRSKKRTLDEGNIIPKPLRKKGLCRMLYFPPLILH